MLGDLSAKYESNGDPGCISTGYNDPGGKSYGMYQFSSKAGTLAEYVSWLQHNGYWFGQELAKYEPASSDFDSAWTWIANGENRDDFAASQHAFIKATFYDPAVQILREHGWDIDKHSYVMQDVVWSRAVQYGVGYIAEMWEDACHAMYNINHGEFVGYPNLTYIDDARFDYDLITAIYLKVCSSEEWNNSALRDSLNQRFESECNDAIARL